MTEMRASDLSSVDMIRKLVGFNTTSRDSNLALIEFVKGYLAGLGVESRLVYDAGNRKANLYATLGPEDRPGIMLSGHTDVVPVDGQDWHSDPFEVVEKGGRLFGRGAADMKSFLAIALAFAPEFLERGLETPIHLALSYDEEVGCLGVRRLIDALNEMPVKPAMCIVGEPTEMKVVLTHKGKKIVRAEARGLECHSSLAPHGVNAIEYAAELIAFMKDLVRRIAAQGPFDSGFDVPHTTIHVGQIQGGTALNIVPKDCWFDFEIRHLPGDDPDALLAEIRDHVEKKLEPMMRAASPEAGFFLQEVSVSPGLDTPAGEAVVNVSKALAQRNDHGKVAFGTEAGLFSNRAGIPTIVCGPGSIEQAHKPDEFITLKQVAECEAFMRRLMDRVCVAKADA